MFTSFPLGRDERKLGEGGREEQDFDTCSDKGAPASILLLATFPAITFASVSRTIL
jgi:hypothetical protein